jgi:hypothetical protein
MPQIRMGHAYRRIGTESETSGIESLLNNSAAFPRPVLQSAS